MRTQCIRRSYLYLFVPIVVLLLDQGCKLWVHTYMIQGSAGEIPLLGNFFKLHYLTNPGLAFGLKISGPYGKSLLTFVRIVVSCGLVYYFYYILRSGYARGFVICIGVILGGALGNVVDSTFYGVWLGNAPLDAPTPWFHGQVIDMFYVDIWEGYLPENLPLVGGNYIFLWPIFNVADASIFTGILILFLFKQRFLKVTEEVEINEEKEESKEVSTLPLSDNL